MKIRNCMQNAARFKELGIPSLINAVGNKRVMPAKDATADHRNDRDCDPDYNPDHHETIDGDLSNTNKSKVLILSMVLYACHVPCLFATIQYNTIHDLY